MPDEADNISYLIMEQLKLIRTPSFNRAAAWNGWKVNLLRQRPTIGRIAPERLSSLRRVATIESIGSSTRIEGAKLSNREVEQLLSNVQLRSFATRDEQEVAGYTPMIRMPSHSRRR